MSPWRARLLVPYALVANAVVQALLVLPDPVPSWDLGFVLGALVSAAAWLATYAIVVARALCSRGELPWPLLRANRWRFAAWTVAWSVVVFVALLPWSGILGLLVFAATPYVGIAAMSGAVNPVAANFRAIGRAPLGFAWRIVVFALLLVVVFVAVALSAFFVTGVLAAFVNSLVIGLLGWLITHSFAREYRSTT